MGTKWDEMKRSLSRSFKTNWNLFKQSKLGLIGLGIIIFFVIIAIFAPLLTLYPPNYLAPAGDLYNIDNTAVNIPKNLTWKYPVAIQTPIFPGKPAKIAGILLYSDSGTAYLYQRKRGGEYDSILRVSNPWEKNIPQGMRYMEYEKQNVKILGFGDTAMYIYNAYFNVEKLDAQKTLNEPQIISVGHKISYVSNVWDYNRTDRSTGTVDANMGTVLTSDKNVTFFLWRYSKISLTAGVTLYESSAIYEKNFTVESRIDGNPILIFDYRGNNTKIIVPTEDNIYGYNINLDIQNITVSNSTVGEYIAGIRNITQIWNFSMTQEGVKYKLKSPNTINVPYPGADETTGKDVVVALCDNNEAFGINTNNGTLRWHIHLMLSPADPRIHSTEFVGIKPSVRGAPILYGDTNIGGFVAKLSPQDGQIMENKTAYMILRGTINYVSRYDPGAQGYYVSTQEGNIYEINETFYTTQEGGTIYMTGLKKSFTVLGGAATPAIFLGNVYGVAATGTYTGVITKTNQLYLQASGGTRIPTIVIPPFSSGKASHNYYFMGTDYEGHDIWSWLVYGARTSLLVGITAAIAEVIAGTFIGIISGFYGGWIDVVIMRTVDIILTLPTLVIMLLLAAVLGPNIWNIVLIIAVLGWAGIARVIRAQTLSLKNRPFMDAARVAGASNSRMITYHIFPNVLPLTFLYMTFGVSGAILAEAALSFLGLGDPNAVSWGMMLQFLRMYGQVTNSNAWAWLVMPGVFITLISLSFYLVGRAFDEIVNPRLRKR